LEFKHVATGEIIDHVPLNRASLENKAVVAGAADQLVSTGSARQGVGAGAAVN